MMFKIVITIPMDCYRDSQIQFHLGNFQIPIEICYSFLIMRFSMLDFLSMMLFSILFILIGKIIIRIITVDFFVINLVELVFLRCITFHWELFKYTKSFPFISFMRNLIPVLGRNIALFDVRLPNKIRSYSFLAQYKKQMMNYVQRNEFIRNLHRDKNPEIGLFIRPKAQLAE